MINISEELKQVYLKDVVPLTDKIAYKQLILYFPELGLTITNDQIESESFEVFQSLSSERNIEFGACEASEMRVTVCDVEEDIEGKKIVVSQVINQEDTVALGEYYVKSAKRQDSRRFKRIVAYDKLAFIDIDVSQWYSELDFEDMNLKVFRESLLTHLGMTIADESVALPNDDMAIEKTVNSSEISARHILTRCLQLSGSFGHIDNQGRFKYITLDPGYGLYPSVTLYPDDNLYPLLESDNSYSDLESQNVSVYRKISYEDYTVKEIDKLVIRTDESDVGTIIGEGTNAYIIEDNFLVYGKSANELEEIGNNIYGYIAKRPYIDFKSTNIGLPFIELGDAVAFKGNKDIVSYVLRRTLKGIQVLVDEYEATGTEQREQHFGVKKEIIALKGKSTKIEKSIEGIKVEIADLEADLSTDIEMLAGKFVVKVDSNGNVGLVQLEADPDTDLTAIKIKADNIELEGLVTVNDNFKILEDGTIEAVNAKFSGAIEGSTITGTAIETYGEDGYFKSTSWDGTSMGVYQNDLIIQNGEMKCAKTYYSPSGHSIEWATFVKYDEIKTKKVDAETVYANSVGTTARPTVAYVSKLQTSDGKVQIEGGANPYLYVDGPTASVVINDGELSCYEVTCNLINGSTPITTSNRNSYTYPPTSHPHSLSDVDGLYSTLQEFDGRLRALGG